jgi:hypothetical protein
VFTLAGVAIEVKEERGKGGKEETRVEPYVRVRPREAVGQPSHPTLARQGFTRETVAYFGRG